MPGFGSRHSVHCRTRCKYGSRHVFTRKAAPTFNHPFSSTLSSRRKKSKDPCVRFTTRPRRADTTKRGRPRSEAGEGGAPSSFASCFLLVALPLKTPSVLRAVPQARGFGRLAGQEGRSARLFLAASHHSRLDNMGLCLGVSENFS